MCRTQIVTEGDSFLVAFHTVAEAVAFCQDLQYKMLDTPWPRAVLRLPGCEPVTNADGDVVMQVSNAGAPALQCSTQKAVFLSPCLACARTCTTGVNLCYALPHVVEDCRAPNTAVQGPRVRMGVHWALPGLVACRPHALTKAPMMVGIAVSIAQEVRTHGC